MGCDIHLVLEVKNPKNDEWVGVRTYDYLRESMLNYHNEVTPGLVGFQIKRRNYEFFDDLCGVRGNGSKFGFSPRGLPHNISSLTELVLSDDTDLHSHSWLTMEELEPILIKHWNELAAVQVAAALAGDSWNSRKLINRLVDDDIGDVYPIDYYRLVFAFDN